MKLLKVLGATSEIWQIFIQDSTSTTGAGLAGLTNASSGLTAYYHRDTDTTATVISLASMTIGTFTSSGFKEIDNTNMPGWYQFCPPNAALASGAKSCAFHLQGATNMAPLPIEVQLSAVNPDSATAFVTSVELSTAAKEGVADTWSNRNVAGGSNTGRTNKQGMYALRNRAQIAGGILTVYEVDDSTPSWDAVVTTAPGDPLTEIDPT